MNRNQFNMQLSFIMKYAHKLYRESDVKSFSEALCLSWAIMRSKVYRKHTKVRGISYHQKTLKELLCLESYEYKIEAVREPSNPYDPNAIAVVANAFVGEQTYNLKLGYLSKSIAEVANQLIKVGGVVHILHSHVTGQEYSRGNLGLNLTYVISTIHR
ncbi:MAG: HIRAN domain-containing protein [Clostridiales bacterium]|nr:HIRAN domain-containing protein [Clostridiales bacterium]